MMRLFRQKIRDKCCPVGNSANFSRSDKATLGKCLNSRAPESTPVIERRNLRENSGTIGAANPSERSIKYLLSNQFERRLIAAVAALNCGEATAEGGLSSKTIPFLNSLANLRTAPFTDFPLARSCPNGQFIVYNPVSCLPRKILPAF